MNDVKISLQTHINPEAFDGITIPTTLSIKELAETLENQVDEEYLLALFDAVNYNASRSFSERLFEHCGQELSRKRDQQITD